MATNVYIGLYDEISKFMDKNKSKYLKNAHSFMLARTEELNAIAPYTKIPHTDKEKKAFWNEIGFKESTVEVAIKSTYYGHKSIKPVSAKDPFTIFLLHIVKYFYDKKDAKNLSLSMLHLSFSGKLYPSCHYNSFRFDPYKHVMDYVVNHKLSYKYSIKKYGSLVNAVGNLNKSWVEAYDKLFTRWKDEDVVYLLDQLVDRIRTMLVNIAKPYYEAYKSNEYMAYNSDNLDDEDYRLAQSDSMIVDKYTSNTMSFLTTRAVDMKLCLSASDSNVRVNQVKNFIEIIVNNPENMDLLREMISIIIMDFLTYKPGGNIKSSEFIVYSIKPRPHTTNKEIIRLKEIQKILLSQSSEYLTRMKRPATNISYIKAFQIYITYAIYKANLN